MRTTNYFKLSALVLGSVIAGCSGNNGASTGPGQGGGNPSGTGGTNNGGGATTVGGTSAHVGGTTANSAGGSAAGGAGVGGNATGGAGVGGNATGGAGVGGNATGGAGVGGNATGGAGVGGNATGGVGVGGNATGGVGVGGNATGGTPQTTGGRTGTGGTPGTATGGTATAATGGTPAATGGGSSCTPAANVLSDFENASTAWQVYRPTPASTPSSSGEPGGVWYAYKDTSTSDSPNCVSSTQVPTLPSNPASVLAGAAPVNLVSNAGGAHPGSNACNLHAFHSSITNCGEYSGFGASLDPSPTVGSTVKYPVDYSNYDGISFWIRYTSSSSGPIYMEFQTTDCIDSSGGGTEPTDYAVDFDCHGKLIPVTSSNTGTWQQVFVPFYNTGPRWFPANSGSSGHTCASGTVCEAARLNTKDLLDIQFSLEQPFDQAPTLASAYDVWVDDLALYKFSDSPANQGLGTWTMSGANPFPQNKAVNAACTKPNDANGQVADGKLLQTAYVNWKTNFVRADGSNQKVISPEIDSGATVSEGIGYGMLLAVYMGDKALFDGLYGYEKAHLAVGTLMNWKIASGGSTSGTGSATDADEDMAFALLEAAKQWPTGGYSATAMISDIWSHDIDKSSLLPTGGSNYSSTSSQVTNPSYFAPAFYREFAKVDSNNWSGVISAVYTAFNSGIGNAVSDGLVSAWCSNNCTATGSNGATTDTEYQYDSHRVPWRLSIDTCWNGTTTGNTYLSKLIGFFNSQSSTAGLANLVDIYMTNGTKDTTNSAPNSMSLIGCAGVGAMVNATNASSFRDRAWQFLLDGQYTDSPPFMGQISGTKGGYTYYNATVGLMAMLTMTGNFYVM